MIQVVFLIWFLYPALYWAGNNIHVRVDSIQQCLGLFNSIGDQLTVDYYRYYNPGPIFSLYLFARAYHVEFKLLKKVSSLDVTVFFLVYMDKLLCIEINSNQEAIGEQ